MKLNVSETVSFIACASVVHSTFGKKNTPDLFTGIRPHVEHVCYMKNSAVEAANFLFRRLALCHMRDS